MVSTVNSSIFTEYVLSYINVLEWKHFTVEFYTTWYITICWSGLLKSNYYTFELQTVIYDPVNHSSVQSTSEFEFFLPYSRSNMSLNVYKTLSIIILQFFCPICLSLLTAKTVQFE